MEHRGISLPRPVFSRRHLLAGVALGACGNRRPRPLHPAPSYTAFHNPRDVRIFGYSGDAMEPFLTRDGRYLLFNNRNEAPANTNLHWAERDGDMAFTYRGEIAA